MYHGSVWYFSGVTGEGSGVTVEGSAPVATPPVADSKASSVLCLFLVYLDYCPYTYNQKNATVLHFWGKTIVQAFSFTSGAASAIVFDFIFIV